MDNEQLSKVIDAISQLHELAARMSSEAAVMKSLAFALAAACEDKQAALEVFDLHVEKVRPAASELQVFDALARDFRRTLLEG